MQDLDYFKNKLLVLRDEITQRANGINKDIRHEGMSADWEEQATERENDEVLESLGHFSEQELDMISNALKRIDAGVYFACSECGESIPLSRLDLLPFTMHCVRCAEKFEH